MKKKGPVVKKSAAPGGKRGRGNITIKDGDLDLWKRFRKLGSSQGYTARGFFELVLREKLGDSTE